MEKITSFNELKTGEKVVNCGSANDKPRFMRFLIIHPRNEKYAYFTDLGERAELVYVNELEHFYKNFTDNDLIEIKRKRALKMLEECDEALKEIEEKGTTYKVL